MDLWKYCVKILKFAKFFLICIKSKFINQYFMAEIKVKNPVVELDGDKMTKLYGHLLKISLLSLILI